MMAAHKGVGRGVHPQRLPCSSVRYNKVKQTKLAIQYFLVLEQMNLELIKFKF